MRTIMSTAVLWGLMGSATAFAADAPILSTSGKFEEQTGEAQRQSRWQLSTQTFRDIATTPKRRTSIGAKVFSRTRRSDTFW